MMFSFSRESFNVLHLSIGFLFVTSSFGAQQYLQEAIIARFANATHLNTEAGYYRYRIASNSAPSIFRNDIRGHIINLRLIDKSCV
jgi:hypothetical protein